ncbi:MAG TPA: signal peptide peptidase SppA [Anaerolineae bacterium]|nr:signal peptide peptidase SppA [Anaerolineae bacterium]
MMSSNESPTTAPTENGVPVIYVKPQANRSTPLFIILSMMIGFLLPICSCGFFFIMFTSSFSQLINEEPTSINDGSPAIAIVDVTGIILSGDEDDFSADALSGVVINDLRTAAADDTVKAIVLRIDSPGGSVTGSAQIYEALLEIDKPIVVSMAGVAASGGYYIAAPADYIYARPDTITGSIGVILTLYNAEDLAQTLGVDVINITSGPNKSMGDMWNEIDSEHQAIFQAMIDESYNEFVRIIAEGRNMDEATVREIADGRIYTGLQAMDVNLVDAVGNRQDAINKAADLGGITGEPRIVEYEHLPSFSDFLTGITYQLNQSESDQILQTVQTFMTPRLEYRYAGPGSTP